MAERRNIIEVSYQELHDLLGISKEHHVINVKTETLSIYAAREVIGVFISGENCTVTQEGEVIEVRKKEDFQHKI